MYFDFFAIQYFLRNPNRTAPSTTDNNGFFGIIISNLLNSCFILNYICQTFYTK